MSQNELNHCLSVTKTVFSFSLLVARSLRRSEHRSPWLRLETHDDPGDGRQAKATSLEQDARYGYRRVRATGADQSDSSCSDTGPNKVACAKWACAFVRPRNNN